MRNVWAMPGKVWGDKGMPGSPFLVERGAQLLCCRSLSQIPGQRMGPSGGQEDLFQLAGTLKQTLPHHLSAESLEPQVLGTEP